MSNQPAASKPAPPATAPLDPVEARALRHAIFSALVHARNLGLADIRKTLADLYIKLRDEMGAPKGE